MEPVAIREVELDPPGDAVVEDGLIWPVPGPERDSILFENRDGDDVQLVPCQGVEFRYLDQKKPSLKVSDVRAQVYVTDARVAVACSRYDKGGGWVGGAGAIALNAGSKVLAARRRRGKMLVGQIRYPCMAGVRAQNKAGFGGMELLRLVAKNRTGPFIVDLKLPKNISATAVATEVIRRTAKFRLAHESKQDLGSELSDQLNVLLTQEPLTWAKGDKQMAGAMLEKSWSLGEFGAKIGL